MLILALPITVVGSNFQRCLEIHQEDLTLYGTSDLNKDGLVDEIELRAFLREKRRDGVLRDDIPLNPTLLLQRFDHDSNNRLSFQEFQALKDYVIDPDAFDPAANMRVILSRSKKNETDLERVQARLDKIEYMLAALLGPEATAKAEAEAKAAAAIRTAAEKKVNNGSL